MGILDALPKIVGKKRNVLDEDKAGVSTGAEFVNAFKMNVQNVTEIEIAAVAAEERAAAKSSKQRKSKRTKTRTDNLSCRADPNVRHVLIALAKKHGGRTLADGLHIAIDLLAQIEGIDPLEADVDA